ncbi:hypothetical protein POM88_015821 [Heracleum sosnowskyi]|uniref:Uncharacterized protein n=1 Tax=Heracleum sosnowskyi TaxID=360622 RepID=A0AAD8IMV6_9APIA|nr:hypothetical protein POM88_015821 [Heracleum sosnowskyi]
MMKYATASGSYLDKEAAKNFVARYRSYEQVAWDVGTEVAVDSLEEKTVVHIDFMQLEKKAYSKWFILSFRRKRLTGGMRFQKVMRASHSGLGLLDFTELQSTLYEKLISLKSLFGLSPVGASMKVGWAFFFAIHIVVEGGKFCLQGGQAFSNTILPETIKIKFISVRLL